MGKAFPQLSSAQKLVSVPKSVGLTQHELKEWALKIKMLKTMVKVNLDPEIKRLPVLVGGKPSGINIAEMSDIYIGAMERHLAVLRGNPSDQNALFSLTKSYDRVMQLFQEQFLFL